MQYEVTSSVCVLITVFYKHTNLTTFLFLCLVKSAWNKPAFFAEKLHLAMKVKLQRNLWNVF